MNGAIEGERSDYEVVRPDPAGTIHSLTSLGYSPEAAVADLVDNSIAAGATRIAIGFRWGGAEGSTVSVTDNGRGMTTEELRLAMTVGAMATTRRPGDLGRFGMGLKTASFSQAHELTVATRAAPGDPWSVRIWDVDHVLAVGEWQLLRHPPAEAVPALTALTDRMTGAGTAVLWRRLTRLAGKESPVTDEAAQRAFYVHVHIIERHLGMVFSRFLTRRRDPIMIKVNGAPVVPWDPFLTEHRFVYPLPVEAPLVGVTVQGFVLPHRSRLSDAEYEAAGGPNGWLDQQGFYVYRQDRLIVAGDWLNLGFRRDDKHVLARLAVDVTTTHDTDWAIDVRKSSATPPAALVSHLRRLAKATREQAWNVMSHKGKVIRDRKSTSVDATWRQMTRFGRTSFQINRDQPLVRDVIQRSPDTRGAIHAMLRMIEETLPVTLIRVTPDAETVADRGEPSQEIIDVASQMLTALINQNAAPSTALDRVLSMPPFDEYPSLRERLASDRHSDTGGQDGEAQR